MFRFLIATAALIMGMRCTNSVPDTVTNSNATTHFDPFGSESRVRVRTDNGLVTLNNGDTVKDNGLIIELFFDPNPPRIRTNVDVRVTDMTTGQAIDDAEITATLSMAFMEHGILIATGEPVGGGHYLTRMTFVMPDEWQVDVRVQTKEKGMRFTLHLLVGL